MRAGRSGLEREPALRGLRDPVQDRRVPKSRTSSRRPTGCSAVPTTRRVEPTLPPGKLCVTAPRFRDAEPTASFDRHRGRSPSNDQGSGTGHSQHAGNGVGERCNPAGHLHAAGGRGRSPEHALHLAPEAREPHPLKHVGGPAPACPGCCVVRPTERETVHRIHTYRGLRAPQLHQRRQCQGRSGRNHPRPDRQRPDGTLERVRGRREPGILRRRCVPTEEHRLPGCGRIPRPRKRPWAAAPTPRR